MGFTATTLTNGKILVAGGQDNCGNVLDTAELYDPAARKFIAVTNTMSDRRMFHTATILLSGKVLVAGGATNLSGDTTNSADIYDPASNSFTPATFPMDHQRAAHTATLFTGGPLAGKVLITGGVGGSSFFFKDSSAEIYDPASQEFLLLASFLNEPRSLHTATLLDDGTCCSREDSAVQSRSRAVCCRARRDRSAIRLRRSIRTPGISLASADSTPKRCDAINR